MRTNPEGKGFLDDLHIGTLGFEDANGMVYVWDWTPDPWNPPLEPLVRDEDVPKLIEWLQERQRLLGNGRVG
jgi:hypothetical protein